MHPLELFKFCPVCGSPHFEIHNEKSKKCADCGFVYYFNSSAWDNDGNGMCFFVKVPFVEFDIYKFIGN